MRLVLAVAIGLAALPAMGQTISPMTGTTAAPPTTPAPPPASAPRARRQTLQQRFDAANTSKDGRLTREQASAGRMAGVAQNFDAIDTGHKGYVTMNDIRAFNRARAAARRGTTKQ